MKRLKFDSVLRPHATACWLVFILLSVSVAAQQSAKPEQVELQPLTAQVKRLVEALDYLGAPLSPGDKQALEKAVNETDAARASRAIQDVLDKYRLIDIHINPESRVKVTQGQARPELVEHGWRTFLIKVRNEAGVPASARASAARPISRAFMASAWEWAAVTSSWMGGWTSIGRWKACATGVLTSRTARPT